MKPLCLLMSLVLPFLAAARPPVPVAADPALSAIAHSWLYQWPT
jgi:hypothetical protein